jgi:hypothetical protein
MQLLYSPGRFDGQFPGQNLDLDSYLPCPLSRA